MRILLFSLLFQVSLKSPEVSVTLPIYIGNIAVNRVPLSPSRSIQHIPSVVVPSAPPEEEEAASGYHPMDNVSIPTKSHSQQQPFSYAPGLSFQEIRVDSEQTGSPNHPTLCLSTGATVPYYAEGNVVPVPTASSLILPPEYSTWGYPYGEQRSQDLQLGGKGSCQQSLLAGWGSGDSVSLTQCWRIPAILCPDWAESSIPLTRISPGRARAGLLPTATRLLPMTPDVKVLRAGAITRERSFLCFSM